MYGLLIRDGELDNEMFYSFDEYSQLVQFIQKDMKHNNELCEYTIYQKDED